MPCSSGSRPGNLINVDVTRNVPCQAHHAGLCVYSTTKTAIRSLVTTGVRDLRVCGIRIGVISPSNTVAGMASRGGRRGYGAQCVARMDRKGGEKLELFAAAQTATPGRRPPQERRRRFNQGHSLGPVLRSPVRGMGTGARPCDFCKGEERSRARGALNSLVSRVFMCPGFLELLGSGPSSAQTTTQSVKK